MPRLLLVLLLTLARLPAWSAAPAAPAPPDADVPGGPVGLRDTAQIYALGRHWSLLTDARPDAADHPLSLAQVRTAPYAARFVPSQELIPNRSTSAADYWLRCQVRVEGGHVGAAWLLVAGLTNSQPFEVFVVPAEEEAVSQEPEAMPVWRQFVRDDDPARPGPRAVAARAPNLLLPPLRPGRAYWLFVHSRGDLFWFSLAERTHYLQTLRRQDAVSAAYFGILLALALYNLLLFLAVRDRGYLYYVLFTVSFALLQAHLTGYWEQLGWPEPGGPGLTQNAVLAAPPQAYSPGDPTICARAGSSMTEKPRPKPTPS